MRIPSLLLTGLLVVSAAACGDRPVGDSSDPAPLIIATQAAASTGREPSSAAAKAYAAASVLASDRSTDTSTLEQATIAGILATLPNSAPPVSAPAGAAPVAETPTPAVVATPKSAATPLPTATPKPVATPVPAGQLTVTGISLERVDQTYFITVTLSNKSAVPISGFLLTVGWLDGGRPRGGDFGVDAPVDHYLIDAGQTYEWTTSTKSAAVTKPIAAFVRQSTVFHGGHWSPPANTAPYTLK